MTKHKVYNREAHLRSNLKRNYGLSLEQYNQMLENQGYKCALCGGDLEGKYGVDHDHITLKVRGILCYNCNHGLADFHDDMDLLALAISYIQEARDESDADN
jgi:DNA-directed RNA polymerase subunit RPC12/RpoP